MPLLSSRVTTLDRRLASLADGIAAWNRFSLVQANVDRFITDAGAVRFHLSRPGDARPIVVLIGGTGTGKSTLLNRLLDARVTATSHIRTYTAGPVAACAAIADWPEQWLGIAPTVLSAEQLPAAGKPDTLVLVQQPAELLTHIHLVDTPDLDGDQPVHHAQADRAFRWADAVLFVVTPEKYQMTELLPYYRLASRYGVSTAFVMNKVERQQVVDDYRKQLVQRGDAAAEQTVFAVPRNDAGYEPPAELNLQSLRSRLASIRPSEGDAKAAAKGRRIADLLSRLRDQVLSPLRDVRNQIDQIAESLEAMETPAVGVDVNPLTEALQRRLQQRSILYLMGPNRVLDRVRQVPGVLARLPRTAWDLLHKNKSDGTDAIDPAAAASLDFRTALVDQMTIVQTRIDDLVRSTSMSHLLSDPSYAASRLPTSQAANIADEEIANLQRWIDGQWNATPRDTAVLMKLLKMLPGGEKLASFSEAAPYVLAIVVAAHHAIFGPVDLMVMGSFGLLTWFTEKVSNEVTSRARLTNRKIADRFERLSHQQLLATTAWLATQAPSREALDAVQRQCDDLQREVGDA